MLGRHEIHPTASQPAAALPAHPWEAAYERFETREQEIRKFVRRLRRLGSSRWHPDAKVLELFCGRGNGLHALHQLGFRNVEGIDLSPRLAAQYKGPGRVCVGDCRELPFPQGSKDIAVVQGGLHHLFSFADLDRTLTQVNRVLKAGGLFVVVEPWLTPFLRLVHALCAVRLVRRFSRKFDALAVMIEHERSTYEQWLGNPDVIIRLLHGHFAAERCVCSWGKLEFVGRNP